MKTGLRHNFYGPRPIEIVSLTTRRFAMLRAVITACVSCLVPLRSLLNDVDRPQALLLSDCSNRLRIDITQPRRVPRGFAIVSAEPATSIGDSVILKVSSGNGKREFEIAQRGRWLPLAEMLATAKIPYSRVTLGWGGREAFVLHGRFGGEPIDHSFWMTRQAVLFESGNIVVELRETRGKGLGLLHMLGYARDLAQTTGSVIRKDS
ncbi:hypothetical protein Q9299_20185 [Gemmobacter fulvus]|uniref:hypothetical protein n=1 Tax=Gemmobacter fulvus TaxID=2840474 RepID=UPI0027967592|nr:hypothetical protein [Gemmobacter fulvus]MDQ1850628.1 hypothetical protein [Gemmobacter fulvus]